MTGDMLIKQTDPRLPVLINKYGCYFRSLQAIAEITVGKQLDYTKIISLYYALQQKKSSLGDGKMIIDNECYVNDPNSVIRAAFQELGADRKCYQIGLVNIVPALPCVPLFWSWVKDVRYDFIINQVVTVHGNAHFVLGDSKGNTIFDPYDPPVTVTAVKRQIYYQLQGA